MVSDLIAPPAPLSFNPQLGQGHLLHSLQASHYANEHDLINKLVAGGRDDRAAQPASQPNGIQMGVPGQVGAPNGPGLPKLDQTQIDKARRIQLLKASISEEFAKSNNN